MPEEYWEILADLSHQSSESRFHVIEYQRTAFKPVNGDQAKSATDALNTATYHVVEQRVSPAKRVHLRHLSRQPSTGVSQRLDLS